MIEATNQKGEPMTKQYNTITIPELFNLIAAKRPDLVYRLKTRQRRHKQAPDGSFEPTIEWYNDDNTQVILINGDDDQQYTLYNSDTESQIIQPGIHAQLTFLSERGLRLVSNTEHRINEAYESELESRLIEIGEAINLTAKHNIYNDTLTLDKTIRNVSSISGAAQCFNHDRVVTSANNLKELLKTLPDTLERQCDPTAIIEALRALNQEIQLIHSDDLQFDEVASLKKPVKTTLQDALKPLLDYYGKQTILDEIEEIESHSDHNDPKW